MNIGIIGLGLMGGSFGRTLVKNGEHTVYAYDLSPSVMKKGELLQAYDYPLSEDNAKNLDMLIVALFPDAFESAVAPYLPLLKDGAVITDFCGTKTKVVKIMQRMAKNHPALTFVGGHPMAGREFSGIEHSQSSMFDKASMILIPVNADIFILERLKKFYLSLGFSRVEITDADNHDAMIAYTSQLCHVVSNAFIKNAQAEKHAGYSAGSYRDLTRVARLNPEMWSQLMIENKERLSGELSELIKNLNDYLVALQNGDKHRLKVLLDEGNRRKISIDSRSGKNA